MISTVKNKVCSILALLALGFWAGCATERPPAEVFNEMVEPFVFDVLALSPITATAMGYHEHVRGGHGENTGDASVTPLDTMLDDYSPSGIAKRVSFYKDFQSRLRGAVDRERLMGQEWADYAIVENQIQKELFELEKARSHEHNPTLYVELVGTSLFTPLVHEYAQKTERYRHIIARLEKLPAFLEQAKQNLQSSPGIWTEVAREENDGNINLVAKVIPAGLPDELKSEYQQVSAKALEALRDFNNYLTTDLAKRDQHDWRLGKDLYAEKFKIYLTTDKSPEELLAEVEADFQKSYDEIIEVARPMHREIYGNQRPPNERALMTDVLDVVADDNRLRSGDQIIDQIKKDLEDLRAFAQEASIVNMPPRDNLQVIETPEFMRGVYSVAGFMPAPPLQPQLGAYYWVTPIPSDWSRAQVNSKLREYNLFKLKLLSMHEAIPGHYIQFEFANEGIEGEPKFRRILRTVFANGSYVEGWAAYATETMVTAGYESSDEMRLNWIKDKLRVQANAILDIRLHTMNMSDEEATDLLRNRAFQESAEVEGKIRRAKLSSVQLPLYYYGWKEWRRVREHYQNETTDFSLTSFHDKALRAGPMPLPELGYITAERAMEP